MRAGTAFVVISVVSAVVAIRVPTGDISASGVDTWRNDTADTTVEFRQAGYGLVKFEGQQNPDQNQYGLITFESQPARPLKFDESNFNTQANANINFPSEDQDLPNHALNYSAENGLDNKLNGVVFQDNNNLEVQSQRPVGQKQRKKRRRRRKPRQQIPGYGGYIGVRPLPGAFPPGGNPYVNPGYPGEFPLAGNPYVNSGYPGQYQRPHRRPKQSAATQALTAVTDALTSIALYDDYQCVPRLLCEAASGGALATAGTSPVLQSIANLQPLLTLLAAYNGASFSPLFVFGRAVFLGMTSKNNPGTCRYAYAQCPNDPEELVHYLNNHNGGFFRFFSAPQYPNPQLGQQNLEQFYNQLAGPGQYGLQTNSPNQPSPLNQFGQQPNINGQNYGIYNPYPVGQLSGLPPQTPGYPDQIPPGQQQNYGLFPNVPGQNLGYQPPNLYNGYQQNYGNGYAYQNNNGLNQYRMYHNETRVQDPAQKRIQNIKLPRQETTIENLDFDDQNTKWSFPESSESNQLYGNRKTRGQRQLQFPEREITSQNVNREAKGFYFPGAQSHRQYDDFYNDMFQLYNNNEVNNGYASTSTSTEKSYINQNNDNANDGFEIIYIVRGDGDPKNPEIHRVRTGERVF